MPTRTTCLRAVGIAEPVAALMPARGMVLGAGSGAAYVDFDGFVVAVTGSAVPAMPNGITLSAPAAPRWSIGESVILDRHSVSGENAVVALQGAATWDPTVTSNACWARDDVARRCQAIIDTRGPDRQMPDGASQLFEALALRDPAEVRTAVDFLVGRGGGLTPEGDDTIAGTEAALCAFGGPAGVSSETQAELLRALCPGDLRVRTTTLSATLIELAVVGKVVEPLLSLLDLGAAQVRWIPELEQLIAVGHSTGRIWTLGCAYAGNALLKTAS